LSQLTQPRRTETGHSALTQPKKKGERYFGPNPTREERGTGHSAMYNISSTEFPQAPVLPTGRIFGSKTQKGLKKWIDWTNFSPNFPLILYRKGWKRGRTSGKFVFLFLFSLILDQDYYTFHTDIDKEKKKSLG
jgi:hypothetical protein